MNTLKTPVEIADELIWLKTNREHIPHFDAFGGNNWEKIDAEIAVLEGNLSEDEIDARFQPDETADEYQESDQDIYGAANDVRSWMDGKSGEGQPSRNWGGLVKSKPRAYSRPGLKAKNSPKQK